MFHEANTYCVMTDKPAALRCWIKLEARNVDFWEEGKTASIPREKSRGATSEPATVSTHVCHWV